MKHTGDKGEILAIEYLQSHGYEIRDTNFRFGKFGEIDVIAQKDMQIIAVEVKYRSHLGYGYPEESVVSSKLKKCYKTLQYYAKKHHISEEYLQFDVIAILKTNSGHRVTHYKNIEIF